MPDTGDRPSPEQDPKTGRFIAGNSGNGGRPKGARAKLAEDFAADLYEKWQAKGKTAIDDMIKNQPADFVKMVAGLMPKDVNLNVNALDEMTEAQLVERMRQLDAILAPFLAAADPGGIAGTEQDSRGAGAPVRH